MTYFSIFSVTREKTQKFLLHISHLHTYTYFAQPIEFYAWVHCMLFPVCPCFTCFRENVIVTENCVFLCSLDNFLLKNVIVFFWEIKFQNGAHLKKKAIFDLLFKFFSHQGKDTKNPSAHISLTHIHLFCSIPIDFFFFLYHGSTARFFLFALVLHVLGKM